MSRGPSSHPAALREPPVPCRVAANVSSREMSEPPRAHETQPRLTCLDLFCGCGGFTLGMQRAGFHVLAAVDSNPQAVATLRANLGEPCAPNLPPVVHVLERDLTAFPPEDLATLLAQPASNHTQLPLVDVIVGGPPCQGFSKVRRVDGANNSPRLINDPRRHLYQAFLRYVDFFQPRIFVMENVLGLRSAVGGAYFTAVQKEARELGRALGRPGYRVHGQIEDAWELGVPQKRHRQLIIGVRNDLPGYFPPDLKPAARAEARPWLWTAIGDLPELRAGGGQDECAYDDERMMKHVEHQGDTAVRYLCDVLEIGRTTRLTNHTARPHSDRDLRDFARLREGENSKEAMRDRCVVFEFPYNKNHFKDRYTRQSRWKPCSTIVAHLSKDGLMFIHPTQNRSLTPREAARIQSFPDWFRFPASRTHAYRLIGNAVPPLVAEAVGLAAMKFLGRDGFHSVPEFSKTTPGQRFTATQNDTHSDHRASHETGSERNPSLPASRTTVARALERLAQLDRRALRALPTTNFLCGWHALLFLFPGLHPDNALDHGETEETWPEAQLVLPGLEQAMRKRYIRSGWPLKNELPPNLALN